MNIKQLKKEYPFLSVDELKFAVERIAPNYKTKGGFIKCLERMNATNEAKATQKDVVSLTIEISWRRSYAYGYNPHASYKVLYSDGTWDSDSGFTCKGCGYDKGSTVVAEICNKILSGMLYRRRKSRKAVPYGIQLKGWFPYFEGGIGVSCYNGIAKFLGGEWKTLASSDTYEKYEMVFKCSKKKAA